MKRNNYHPRPRIPEWIVWLMLGFVFVGFMAWLAGKIIETWKILTSM